MEVTIREAAQIVGRSTRAVRNMAQSGRVKARRVGRRWMVDRESLNSVLGPAPDVRRTQVAELREKLNQSLDRATPTPPETSQRSYYSVRQLDACTVACVALQQLAELEAEPRQALAEAEAALREFLRALTESVHQFHPELKIKCLLRARSHACTALADLIAYDTVHDTPAITALADRIEGVLLASLTGLIRHAERRRKGRS